MKKILFLLMAVFLANCSSKKKTVAAVQTASMEDSLVITNSNKTTDLIVQNVLDLEKTKKFKSLFIKASARYEDTYQSQNVQADIRIKKDQIILVSVRFVGITMAKALITPDKVQYYEKANGTHFEGDFTTLSRWLGTELNFEKLQNLLIGNALFDLSKEKLESKSNDNEHGLYANNHRIEKEFWIQKDNHYLVKQSFLRKPENQNLQVHYPSFQQHQGFVLPSQILLEAIQESQKTSISLKYTSVVLNEDFSFPYSVPQGSKLINID
jgi:hypothetical protein